MEQRSEKVRNRKRKVVGLLEGEFESREVKEVLREMSTRYLLSHRSKEIVPHIRLILARKDRPLVLQVAHEPQVSYSNITIVTLDIPGLFSKITGVMAANGINILGAQISTMNNGIALDSLQVSSPAGEIIADPAKWRQVEENLTAVIEGRVRVADLVKKRHRSNLLPSQPRPRLPNKVEIDNEVSDEYTVIDIFAHDRIGLLYEITKTLKELGLYIGISKISTKVDQVADTFYVSDIFSQKITAAEKMDEIRRKLLECLEEE